MKLTFIYTIFLTGLLFLSASNYAQDLQRSTKVNYISNPFEVNEVYIKLDGSWNLGSLSFTRLISRSE